MERITIITTNLNQTVTAWSNLSDNLFFPHTEAEYQKLIAILDELGLGIK